MTDALLPCPFCGCIDLFVDTVDGSLPPQTGQTVSCEDCTAKASYGDWNTRQPTQSDVERVTRALAQADRIEICSDATYALSSYGHKAQAALAAMRQPTQNDALLDAEGVKLYWYRQGKDDGVEHERAKIVAWLREQDGHGYDAMRAECIEAGEHLK